MFDHEELLQLLLTIKYDSESYFLTSYFSNVELYELVIYANEKNFIILENESYKLTLFGEKEIQIQKKILEKKGIDGNITLLKKYKKSSKNINDIYIPIKK